MSTALGAALLGVEEALADMGRNSSIVSHGYQKLFTRQIFDMVRVEGVLENMLLGKPIIDRDLKSQAPAIVSLAK